MPFSRVQFQQRIQQTLNDTAGIWFDAQSCIDSIQDGYDEIACDTQCIEATISLPFNNTAIYYDLYNIIPGFMRPVRVFNQNTNRWLAIYDTRYLDRYRYNWEVASSSPWWATIINHQYLSFFPHYSKGAGLSFDLFYKVCPDILTDDDQILQIPDSFENVLETYCVADLLESMGEIKKATGYWSDYAQNVQRLKEHVAGRMLPDLYYVLEELP